MVAYSRSSRLLFFFFLFPIYSISCGWCFLSTIHGGFRAYVLRPPRVPHIIFIHSPRTRRTPLRVRQIAWVENKKHATPLVLSEETKCTLFLQITRTKLVGRVRVYTEKGRIAPVTIYSGGSGGTDKNNDKALYGKQKRLPSQIEQDNVPSVYL